MHHRWTSLLTAALALLNVPAWAAAPATQTSTRTTAASAPATAPNTSTAPAALSWAELNTQIDQAAASLSKSPDDLAIRRKLAQLYLRRMIRPEASAAVQQESITRALEILQAAYQKDPTDLDTAQWLAQALLAKDYSAAGAGKALDIYASFMDSPDAGRRFKALMARATFIVGLRLPAGAYAELQKHGQVRLANPVDEAIATFHQAMDVEPADSDGAERSLADLYFSLARFADAEALYVRILDGHKSSADINLVVQRLIECQLREVAAAPAQNQAKLRDAMARLDDLLHDHPDDAEGLILRTYAYQLAIEGTPRWEDRQVLMHAALNDAERATQLSPGNPVAVYYHVMAAMRLSDSRDDALIDELLQQVRSGRFDAGVWTLLSDLCQRQQRPQEAVALGRQLLQQAPARVDMADLYAHLLLKLAIQRRSLPKGSQGELAATLAQIDPESALDQLLADSARRSPDDARWPTLRAQLQLLAGDAASAARTYGELRRTQPDNLALLENYLKALRETKDYQGVLSAVTPVIDANASAVDTHPERHVFYLHRATALQGLKRDQEASGDVDRALDLALRFAAKYRTTVPLEALLDEAQTLLPTETTAACLRRRLEADPGNEFARAALLRVLNAAHQPQEALAVARKAAAPITLDFLLYQKARAEESGNDLAGAERDFAALYQTHPGSVPILNNYAMFLAEHTSQSAKALSIAERARDILLLGLYEAGVWAKVYDTLGFVKLRSGDLPTAVTLLRRSLRMEPAADTYVHLIPALQQLGRAEEATQALVEGVKFDAHLPELLTKLEKDLNVPQK